MGTKEVLIDPKVGNGKAGINVKGREVSNVVSGGQSDKAGVKLGWQVADRKLITAWLSVCGRQVMAVAGKNVTADSKAILAALKAAKDAGKKFKVGLLQLMGAESS